jgi:hypothetical protein
MAASAHHAVRRLIGRYVAGLLLATAVLGALHLAWPDLRAGRIHWFNLDKERNLPTWFSGAIMCLLGCAACAAWTCERRLRAAGRNCFRAGVLWLGVAAVAWLMSLDEITILHENLFWKETRLATEKIGPAWIHVTQWQVLFALPALAVVIFFALFFWNRYSASRLALCSALGGLFSWIVAHSLEGVRGAFKLSGPGWYSLEVLIEELFEILGAVLILASVAVYVADITLDLDARQQRLGRPLITRRSAAVSLTAAALLLAGFGVTYFQARRQAEAGAATPELYERAKREEDAPAVPPEPKVDEEEAVPVPED